MLYTNQLYGQIKCEDDNAQCVLDAEGSKRGMRVRGSGSGKVTLRSLTFKDGEATRGGGVYIRDAIVDFVMRIDIDAIVDIELCSFVDNRHTSSGKGGALFVYSATVNIIASSFQGNTADSGNVNDVYNDGGTVTVESECPAPYSANSHTKGELGARLEARWG